MTEVDSSSRFYKKHIVAFADILGFKAMIGQVEAGTLDYRQLHRCLSFS